MRASGASVSDVSERHVRRLKKMIEWRRGLAAKFDDDPMRSAHRAAEIDALEWALDLIDDDRGVSL